MSKMLCLFDIVVLHYVLMIPGQIGLDCQGTKVLPVRKGAEVSTIVRVLSVRPQSGEKRI